MAGFTQAQIDQMSFEQLQALGFPVATDAQYVTGTHVPGYDGNTTGSGLPGLPKLPDVPKILGMNLYDPDSALGKTIGGVAGAAKTVSAGFNFITDIPRVATTVIGGIMIAAGIFAISRGSNVINVITKPGG